MNSVRLISQSNSRAGTRETMPDPMVTCPGPTRRRSRCGDILRHGLSRPAQAESRDRVICGNDRPSQIRIGPRAEQPIDFDFRSSDRGSDSFQAHQGPLPDPRPGQRTVCKRSFHASCAARENGLEFEFHTDLIPTKAAPGYQLVLAPFKQVPHTTCEVQKNRVTHESQPRGHILTTLSIVTLPPRCRSEK